MYRVKWNYTLGDGIPKVGGPLDYEIIKGKSEETGNTP